MRTMAVTFTLRERRDRQHVGSYLGSAMRITSPATRSASC